ncbi:cyclin-D6-1-like [Zingiber officinale]|uniref:cyclin-D6-1-like n=1 Tax=Zingiber officinale TaxID=94328 RepID=UPI001C4BF626|nr:cyclin-D6-1-like [Zingiber officinale]
MESDIDNQLMNSEELQCSSSISNLLVAEADHITSVMIGAIDLCARREAVTLVLKVQSHCDLKPSVACLAVSYIDRYLSKRTIPRDKPWIVRLLAISCLFLASKMQMTIIAIEDLQRNEEFVFDLRTIQRMELLVLGALYWRMQSITPFSFLPLFLSFFSQLQPSLLQALQSHATDILLKALNDIKILEFKPSVVAASALASAAFQFFPVQSLSFQAALASSNFVDKENLRDCSNAMAVTATLTSSPEMPMTAQPSQQRQPIEHPEYATQE